MVAESTLIAVRKGHDPVLVPIWNLILPHICLLDDDLVLKFVGCFKIRVIIWIHKGPNRQEDITRSDHVLGQRDFLGTVVGGYGMILTDSHQTLIAPLGVWQRNRDG